MMRKYASRSLVLVLCACNLLVLGSVWAVQSENMQHQQDRIDEQRREEQSEEDRIWEDRRLDQQRLEKSIDDRRYDDRRWDEEHHRHL